MIRSIGLLIVIIVMVLFASFEVAQFFLGEKKHRAFWLKWWAILSVLIGVFFWVILMFWG